MNRKPVRNDNKIHVWGLGHVRPWVVIALWIIFIILLISNFI